MKVRYEVTEANYTDVIQYQLDSNKNSLPKTVIFYILILLFPILGLYLLFYGTGYHLYVRILFLVLTLFISGARLWRRNNTRPKAEHVLKNVLQNGLLQKDFIGPHTLEVRDGTITDAFGEEKLQVGCQDITRIERLERVTILFCGPNMFQVLPNACLEKDGIGDRLYQELRQGAEKGLGSRRQEQLSILPEDAEYKLSWTWTEQSYVKSMAAAKRGSLLVDKRRGVISIVFLLLSIGVLVYSLLQGQTGMAAVIFLIALVMNREFLFIYTPLAEWRSRQRYNKLRDSLNELYLDTYLYLTEDKLYYVAFDSNSVMEYKEVKKVAVRNGTLLIYFGMLQYVAVPKAAEKVDSIERLVSVLESRAAL